MQIQNQSYDEQKSLLTPMPTEILKNKENQVEHEQGK
jgi:hypothetical protein